MIDFIKAESERAHQLPVTNIQYFNGISDLSYVAYRDAGGDGWRAYEANTPVFGTSYTIPFHEMSQLQAPVLNIGPRGRDAHKKTERLHAHSAFVEVPFIIEQLIHNMMGEHSE
ncbi:hypothetical protein [Geomicrobium sp. JCM 19039]|uniref:hypothetical protein n=1 Tax=Geomicrobium sp. JCM 19039 TaxID=1460636 RepID=UPI001EE6844B|nr:hypothetical protein [Geomicrobium sp. JCM 19039]